MTSVCLPQLCNVKPANLCFTALGRDMLVPAQRTRRRMNVRVQCLKEANPTSQSAGAEDWMAAAFGSDEKEIDEETLNEVCNIALRGMLDEDENKLYLLRVELNEIELFFRQRENKAGAMFISSLVKLTEHEISEEVDELEGKYKDAFLKVFGLVEDCGWSVKHAGETDEEEIP